MTITTQTVVNVGAAVMDTVPVGIARDFLQGYSGDYVFFQYSQAGALSADEYILITGTDLSFDDETGYIVTGDSFTVFDITALSSINSISHNDSFSGSVIGVEGGAVAENFSGSITRNDSELVQQWITQVYTVDHSVSVVNDGVSGADYLVYSSLENHPHLIQGVENYAFLQTVLFLAGICFAVVHGIFKHVSN